MIALSTIWGRDRFESYSAMFAGLRETFPSFESTHPAWDGFAAPPARVFRNAGVSCAGILLVARGIDPGAPGERGRAALDAIASAAAAARESGGPGVSLDAGPVPRVVGWDEFRAALRAEGPNREKTIAEGLAYRRDCWSKGLENLARNLHAACASSPGIEIRVQTPQDPSMYPSPEELSLLLSEVRSPLLKYCHCAGRAEFLKRSAGWDEEAWLEAAGDRTAACVADDGSELGHGLLPGLGAVDYSRLAGRLPARATVVLRPPSTASAAQVAAAAAVLSSARLCRS